MCQKCVAMLALLNSGLGSQLFFVHAHVGSRFVSKNGQSRMKHIYEHNRMAHAYI